MSVNNNMMSVGGNPRGIPGRLAGLIMNVGHKPIYARAVGRLNIGKADAILDIGCGGGKAVAIMARLAADGRVCGIDQSPTMVGAARKLNKRAVAAHQAEIREASVDALPYDGDTFDIVTAFETIQFWPDIGRGLSEIKRVLRPDGRLLIVNRFPPPDSKWCAILQLKSADDYERALSGAGFGAIEQDIASITGWIMAQAQKQTIHSAGQSGAFLHILLTVSACC